MSKAKSYLIHQPQIDLVKRKLRQLSQYADGADDNICVEWIVDDLEALFSEIQTSQRLSVTKPEIEEDFEFAARHTE